MIDTLQYWLTDEQMTKTSGASLAHTLYDAQCTVWLTGELGAGKTTFLRAFLTELGVSDPVTSPTFALEQRYRTHQVGELLHIDLYRLAPKEAEIFLRHSADHQGIRCVEWADRLPASARTEGIHIHLEDPPGKKGRGLTVTFDDLRIPTDAEIEAWRIDVCLPLMICRHSDAVAEMADHLSAALMTQGKLIRLKALHAAGRTHDLLRFIDFGKGASHIEREGNPEHEKRWEEIKAQYPRMRHEAACSAFLEEKGYPAIARMVKTHGLTLISPDRITIEQKLLYYADKRIKLDEVVSLEERLRDFTERYSRKGFLEESDAWYEEARRTEKELFPDGPPF